MATLYEDEVIEPEDPRILKYRLVIRNPEELWLALDAIWEFFHAGATQVVSPELMDQAQQYIISELRYIDEHNVLHPSMIANLSKKGKKSNNHYNFKSYG